MLIFNTFADASPYIDIAGVASSNLATPTIPLPFKRPALRLCTDEPIARALLLR